MNPKWPKVFPPLTPEQVRIGNDFMEHWHQQLASRFGIIETFNHGYPVKHCPPDFVRTLEVGVRVRLAVSGAVRRSGGGGAAPGGLA